MVTSMKEVFLNDGTISSNVHTNILNTGGDPLSEATCPTRGNTNGDSITRKNSKVGHTKVYFH